MNTERTPTILFSADDANPCLQVRYLTMRFSKESWVAPQSQPDHYIVMTNLSALPSRAEIHLRHDGNLFCCCTNGSLICYHTASLITILTVAVSSAQFISRIVKGPT